MHKFLEKSPCQGANCKLNCHSTVTFNIELWASSSSTFLPLYDTTRLGEPPLAAILQNLQINYGKSCFLYKHCAKRVLISSFSGPYFLAFELKTVKYGPEKLWIRTLFTQCKSNNTTLLDAKIWRKTHALFMFFSFEF